MTTKPKLNKFDKFILAVLVVFFTACALGWVFVYLGWLAGFGWGRGYWSYVAFLLAARLTYQFSKFKVEL